MSRFTVLRGSLMLFLLATLSGWLRAQQQTAGPAGKTDGAIAKALAAKTDINAINVPLEDFIGPLAREHGITITLDKSGLKRAGVAPSTQITASFKQVPLGVVLRQILRPLKLQFRVADGSVVIDDIGLPLDAAHPPGSGPVGPQRIQPVEIQVERMLPQPMPMRRVGVAARRNQNAASLQQLRLILQVELALIKSLCAPTPEQMEQLKHDGLKHIADAADNWQRVNGRGVLDPRRVVQYKLVESVRSRLSPAQARQYESEIQKRLANIREACARNLVVAIDQELSLTESQRHKLCTELASNWEDVWTMNVVVSAENERGFLPNVPDELVLPYLDAAQRALWNSLQKGNILWGPGRAAFLGAPPPALEDQE
ncbi:MAG TPA: hypothetical protein VEI07_13565 [Planctomycetaceae bacterium]|nr:hypothetical protein [Planctomycetaceae bacterium]